jgi:hypothetical protein
VTSLAGMAAVREVIGTFSLTNVVLTATDAIAVERAGAFSINDCPNLTSVTLPALAVVDGQLSIARNDAIGSVSLPALTSAGELFIATNSGLQSMSAPALATVGTLFLLSNVGLNSYDFSALTSASELHIGSSPQLTAITGFSLPRLDTLRIADNGSLARIDVDVDDIDTVVIERNPPLTEVLLSQTTSLGSLRLEGNGGLSPITVDLGAVTSAGALLFRENGSGGGAPPVVDVDLGALASFGGLVVRDLAFPDTSLVRLQMGAVTTCGNVDLAGPHDIVGVLGPATRCETVSATDSGSTMDATAFANVTSMAALFVTSEGLQDLTGFANLRTVDGDVRFRQSVFTGDLSGIGGLTSVGGAFEWSNNQGGTLPAFPALTTLGALEARNQFVTFGGFPALTSLGGIVFDNGGVTLGGMPGVTALSGSLTLRNLKALNGAPSLTSVGGVEDGDLIVENVAIDDATLASLLSSADLSAVGTVRIVGLSVASLAPFAGLRDVATLVLTDVPNVTSLAPLAQVRRIGVLLEVRRTGVVSVDVIDSHDNLLAQPVTFVQSENGVS